MSVFAFSFQPSEKVDKLEERAKTPNAPCQKQMVAWIDCMKSARVSVAAWN